MRYLSLVQEMRSSVLPSELSVQCRSTAYDSIQRMEPMGGIFVVWRRDVHHKAAGAGGKIIIMILTQVTAIALRLLSIWLLIQLVLNLPSLIMLFSSIKQYQQQDIPPGVYAGVICSLLLIGLVIAFLINKAATSVLTRARTRSEESLSHDSQRFLFQLAGLYFVVDAVAHLPRSLGGIPHVTEITLSMMLWPAGLAFQLAVGLWLVSNSALWLNLFRKLRGRT